MYLRGVLWGTILCASIALGAPFPESGESNSVGPSDHDLVSVLSSHLNSLSPGQTRSHDDELVAEILSNFEGIKHGGIVNRSSLSVQDLINLVSAIVDKGIDGILDLARIVTDSGLLPSHIVDFLNGFLTEEINSIHNKNHIEPTLPVFPSKLPDDAPYSVDENALRSAIYIPAEFEYCKNGKPPLIFIPGTGVPAGTTFHFAFRKQFAAAGIADPVWVNFPEASLNDVQVTAEYVAYAINYISGICGDSKVILLSWSQGGLDVQWALKYWPSTHALVQDFIPIAAPFGGTEVAHLFCPDGAYSVTCVPAYLQQATGSNLLDVLEADYGRLAYVPTTTIYTAFDEIVKPMTGPHASGIIYPREGVPVSNNKLQDVCFGQLAGSLYSHQLILVNPLTWALIEDAIKNPGPGDPSRIPWLRWSVCNGFLGPELDLDDALGVLGLATVVVATLLGFEHKGTVEPPIMPYAL